MIKNVLFLWRNLIPLFWMSLVVQQLRLCAPNAGGPGLIPGQGTRSHMLQLRPRMPQLRPCMPQLKDPALRSEDSARSNRRSRVPQLKTRCSQINK